MEFCRSKASSTVKKETKKRSLLKKLRVKFSGGKLSESDSEVDEEKKKKPSTKEESHSANGDKDSDNDMKEDRNKYSKKNLLKGNANAIKVNRRIEIGWLMFDLTTQRYKQVRSRNGGGTRSETFNKGATIQDALIAGKKLFFPGGRSKKGDEEQFLFEVRDFSENVCQLDETIGGLYEKTKVKTLRLYICTKPRFRASDLDSSDADSIILPPLAQPRKGSHENRSTDVKLSTASSPNVTEQQQNISTGRNKTLITPNFNTNGDQNVAVEGTRTLVDYTSEGCTDTDIASFLSNSQAMQQIFDETQMAVTNIIPAEKQEVAQYAVVPMLSANSVSDETNDILDGIQILNDSQEIHFGPGTSSPTLSMLYDTIPFSPDTSSGRTERLIRVPIASPVDTIINQFKEPSILQVDINFERITPDGQTEAGSGVGVVRDIITHFWSEFYERCTVGKDYKIPYLRHDYQECEWQAIARFLVFGWNTCGYLPLQIAPPFLEETLYGKITYDLVDTFCKFINDMERDTLNCALHNFADADEDDLLEVMDNHKCIRVPSAENIKILLQEIAHKELIQESMYVIKCWRPILLQVAKTLSHEMFLEKCKSLELSTRKVMKLLRFPNPMSNQEKMVADFLKKYIQELDQKTLRSFMRYMTGSDILLADTLTIDFCDLEAGPATRRPIAHTCGCSLTLCRTYDSFPDFRSEFNSVLSSGVWIMDIV